MHDRKLFDIINVMAYPGIGLWLCAFVIYVMSKSRIVLSNDKKLSKMNKRLTYCRLHMVISSLLILLFTLTRTYYAVVILVALLVCMILPAYFMIFYTKRILEKANSNRKSKEIIS